ncbi:unnamed protein product [Moneuplotes crassus]|uniref:Uncharacterized protein n=1 Tax=Euplotes crassus TaxID=5936 RepID=A0AAD1XTH2_EUPCR|nr:unnamed protein product [Moneuplotes crassus]
MNIQKETNELNHSHKPLDNRDSYSFKPTTMFNRETNLSNTDIAMSFGSGYLGNDKSIREVDVDEGL